MAGGLAVLTLAVGACAESADTTSISTSPSTASAVEGPTVGYVRITWRQDLNVQCSTPETFDNGGSDSAVIEVWGPSEEGRWRADMVAPSGETEVVIADVAEDGTVFESWGTYNWANPMPRGPSFEELTAFRNVECVTSTPTARESISVSDGPYAPGRLPFPHLIPVGTERRVDVVQSLPTLAADRRGDTWMGDEYDVYITSSEPSPDTTGQSQTKEFWLNRETDLIDRVVGSNQDTRTGSSETVIEFVERGTRPLDAVSFDPTGLQQITNLQAFLDAEESTETTDSSPDTASPPSQTADEAIRDGVLPEVAALPYEVRVNVIGPASLRASTRVPTDQGVWVVSKPDTDRYDGDPLVGDTDGIYGRDFVHLPTYGEILLLDASETEILRAFPITPAATPGQLAASFDAVYCHRAGDGGEPDSTLCRIDRSTFEMTVRIFPVLEGSAFEAPDTWIPDHWTIDAPIEGTLDGVLEVDTGLRLVSDRATLEFDPETLALLSASE